MGMLEAGSRLGLANQPLDGLTALLWILPIPRLDSLDGDFALEPRVVGQVNDAHGSLAQFPHDLIAIFRRHERSLYWCGRGILACVGLFFNVSTARNTVAPKTRTTARNEATIVGSGFDRHLTERGFTLTVLSGETSHERSVLRRGEPLLENSEHAHLVVAPERCGIEPQSGEAARGPFVPDELRLADHSDKVLANAHPLVQTQLDAEISSAAGEVHFHDQFRSSRGGFTFVARLAAELRQI